MPTLTTVQRVMGGTFLFMGLGSLVLPSPLIDLCMQPEYFNNSDGERFLFSCFGAQASLQGVLLLSSKFVKRTWLYWGLAIVPFVVFDVYCCPVGPFPILSWFGAIGDGIGNAIFLACCSYGYLHADDEDAHAKGE